MARMQDTYLYMNDPNLTEEQEKEIKLKLSKGGAFKNIYVNAKGKDGKKPELTPIGQVEAKDAFKDIKSMTTNEMFWPVIAFHWN